MLPLGSDMHSLSVPADALTPTTTRPMPDPISPPPAAPPATTSGSSNIGAIARGTIGSLLGLGVMYRVLVYLGLLC